MSPPRDETLLRNLAHEVARRVRPEIENVVTFESIDSTHAAALRIMETVDAEELDLRPTLIIAMTQSRGVGRGGRGWSSRAGGLHLSWVGSRLGGNVTSRLPMIAAAAAHGAITEAGIADAAIKWPNDILVRGKKLAGLLIHSRGGDGAAVTIGFGLNLRRVTEELDRPIHPPTSVEEIVGASDLETEMIGISVSFVTHLHRYLDDPDSALATWHARLVHHVNDPMTVRTNAGETVSGTFSGLTEEGFLRLRTDTGELTISSGDVVEG